MLQKTDYHWKKWIIQQFIRTISYSLSTSEHTHHFIEYMEDGEALRRGVSSKRSALWEST
jgi:hypothetical protein